ncbi:ribokinase [Bacillus sp. SLBN-46]|uniref:ribokinase n=1 Tax=Bacillus sp. SLBN-46 TaxID=3042283 RepID=UPI0028567C42|nr:ribokinase [Bacillus sp. SLBN-46]MDR6125283.1 ribokinase [Bacillus sp. SLBN-46]
MNNLKSSKILVLGSYNVDISSSMAKFPQPGETVLGSGFQKGPGGKGSNQAIAAARLGGNVSFMGCIGDDIFGQEAVRLFSDEGIETNYLIVDPTQPTGTAVILVEESGENQIVVTPGANHQLLSEHIDGKIDFKDISWLILQMEVPFESVKRAVECAKAEGVKVIMNPAPVLKEIVELLPSIDVLTPNETEAQVLTGISIETLQDVEKAAKWFLQKGTKAVSMTLGSKGAYIAFMNQNGFVGKHIPSRKVNAIDTTGAGDCFNGALAVALSEGNAFQESVEFAVKAASLSVQRKGAGVSMPFRREIDQE